MPRTHLKIIGLCIALGLSTLLPLPQTQAQDAAKPAVRLIAETEDFKVTSPGWSIVPFRENYFASTFATSFLSRMACLGAPEQLPEGEEAVAEQEVELPYADTYELLARYEQPFQFSCEFTVEIEQKGKIKATFQCGRLQDPKIWALTQDRVTPMERHIWGAGDCIIWQHPGSVALEAGSAIIRLKAREQKDGKKLRVNAACRNVDVIMLTNDKQGMETQMRARYLPFDGWLTQNGDLFARLTNRGDKPVMPRLASLAVGQHSPYYIHLRNWSVMDVLAKGRITYHLPIGVVSPHASKAAITEPPYMDIGPRSAAVRPAEIAPELDKASFIPPVDENAKGKPAPQMVFQDADKLQPRQKSGWLPIGQMMDALHDSHWILNTDVPLDVEFGIPNGKGGIRSIKKLSLKGNTEFEIPGNIAPNPELAKILRARWWAPQIRTVQEALVWLTSEVKKFPKVGKVPERFLIYSIGGFGSTPKTPEGQALMAALGDNTGGERWKGKKRQLICHWHSTSAEFYETQDLSDIAGISYGDDMHLPAIKLDDATFAAWLKARGVKYNGPVTWGGDRSNPLYYYSQLAGIEEGVKPYIAATAHYKKNGVLTGANYSPHANYLVSDIHYVLPFKLNALSMAWSEDYVWQVPEFSVQASGYLATAFRCGVKYNGQPIQMYVMPHSPGNTPTDFRRSFYTCVANGATIINYFCASPLATGATENYVATSDLAMWREIHRCTHEAGIFEDYVMDAAVRPARVGLLLSGVEDIWSGAHNFSLAIHNAERKALYYALRHSQTPVDMLTEDDVIDGLDGLCKDIDVIYVTQQWMHSRCVNALRKWVENGGTLVALCGGGFMDEFNKPSTAAAELYGVKAEAPQPDPKLVSKYLLKENAPFLAKQDLPLYEPIDLVTWQIDTDKAAVSNVPIIVWKQRITLEKGTTALGTFKDGAPAVTAKKHGKGTAYLFAFLPGQAYLKSGLPTRPFDRGARDEAFDHFLPTDMDKNLRARLVDDFLPAAFNRPVVCSEDLVETACLDTPALKGKPARLAVPLINFTPKAMQKLIVKVTGVPKAASVTSVRKGKLKPVFEGDVMSVTLPLEEADMLLVDR